MLHEVTGDLAAAGTALAGLILVYLGAVAVRYESLDATSRTERRGYYRRHARLAFVGIVSALTTVLFALIAKAQQSDALTHLSAAALIVSLGIAVVAAYWTLNAIE